MDRTTDRMNGSGANAGSPAQSRSEFPSRSGMAAVQGFNRIPGQPQNVDVCSSSGLTLETWIRDGGPWVALDQVSLRNTFEPSPSFQQYRQALTHVASEDSTNFTDSGYVSLPQHSVCTRSVYGGDVDHSTDTQSLGGRLEDFVFYSSGFPGFPTDQNAQHKVNTNNWGQAGEQPMFTSNSKNTNNSQSSNKNTQASVGTRVCDACEREGRIPSRFRTASELKKHEARHTKPHRCEVPDCTRTDGFVTANDLVRHIRSRHPAKAPGLFYKCHLGACANTTKLWPRADNFRQHLKRKHNYSDPLENIEQFVHNKAEPAPDERESGPVGLHMGSVGADPAVIQSLTSRALGPMADLPARDTHRPDIQMADTEPGFPQDVSLMVGGQFSGVRTPTNAPDQDELHHTEDGQALHSGHDELHIGHDITRPILQTLRKEDLLEPRPRSESSWTREDLERHSATVDATSAVSDGRPTRENIGSFASAATDLSRSGGSSSGLDSCPENGGFADEDEDQPGDDGDDQSATSDEGTLGTGAELESSSMTANSHEEVPQAHGSNSAAMDPPQVTISTPAPNEDGNASKIDSLARIWRQLEEMGGSRELEELLERKGYERARSSSSKTKKTSPSQGTGTGPLVACPTPGCESSFQRECELRKHMKRHDRPYGCTYKPCSKRFGSKSDWKRHENSQHNSIEVWRCDENSKPLPGHGDKVHMCDKVYHRRETFKAHLQRDHGFDLSPSGTSTARFAEKLNSCRQDKDDEATFWCGFCQLNVETKGEAGYCTERYAHIDAHLCGRDTPKRIFEDWVYREDHMSLHQDPSSAPSTVRSTPAGPGTGHISSPSSEYYRDKRRSGGSDAEHSRRAKRTRVGKQQASVWFCCSCRYWNSLIFTDTCLGGDLDCKHSRCSDCKIQATAEEQVIRAA